MTHSSFRLNYPSESLSVHWVAFVTRSSILSSDWTPLTLLQRWLSTLIWLLVVCLQLSPLWICYTALFSFFVILFAQQFSLDRNFLHWPSLYAWLFTPKCMFVCFMQNKFVYELYWEKKNRGNPFMWMLEFREQFLHLLKWPKVLCVIFLNQNFSLYALVRVLLQVLFFSATHGLELFDSSALNRYDIFSLCNCEKFFVVEKCKRIFHC